MSDDEAEEVIDNYVIEYVGEDMGEDEENKRKFVARDGVATATFNNGDSYTGSYMGGKRHGKGKYTFVAAGGGEEEEDPKVVTYQGDYINGTKSGVGKFVYPDGSVYFGEWANNKRHGMGTYTYPNGDRYCGQWVNGTKEGNGTYLYKADGTMVTGTFNGDNCLSGSWEYYDEKDVRFSAEHAGSSTVRYSSDNLLPAAVQKKVARGETKIVVRTSIEASAEKVWDCVGKFDDLDWIGKGLIKTVEGKVRWINSGSLFKETELFRDENNKFYLWSNESVPNMVVRLQVYPRGDSSCVFEYRTTSSLPEIACEKFEALYKKTAKSVKEKMEAKK